MLAARCTMLVAFFGRARAMRRRHALRPAYGTNTDLSQSRTYDEEFAGKPDTGRAVDRRTCSVRTSQRRRDRPAGDAPGGEERQACICRIGDEAHRCRGEALL